MTESPSNTRNSYSNYSFSVTTHRPREPLYTYEQATTDSN